MTLTLTVTFDIWPQNHTISRMSHSLYYVTCQFPLTVKHILIECTDFRDIRNKFFVASTMKDVFEQVSMRNVINFIKETHFYNLL